MTVQTLPTAPLVATVKRLGLSQRDVGELLSDALGAKPESVQRRWCRMAARGELAAELADRIACELGFHPGEIWGWDVYLQLNGPDECDRGNHAWDAEVEAECVWCGAQRVAS